MTSFNHYAVQEMVRGLLTADAPLAGKVSGIFDFVPEKTEFPYITIGESRVEDESTVAIAIARVTLTVQVYSRAKGRKEADSLMADVHRILQNASGSAAGGFALADMRFGGSDITLLRDGATHHGRMRFVLRLQTIGA